MNLTIEQKKKWLCWTIAEQMITDYRTKDMFHMMWDGFDGYKDYTDEEIEEEWNDIVNNLSDYERTEFEKEAANFR